MSLIWDGIPASPGISIGRALVVHVDRPRVPHETVPPERVEEEVRRFQEARDWTRRRIEEIRDSTAERLGPVEAQIFEAQIVMLDDVDLVRGTESYIRDNRLSAARALELQMLEFQSQWRETDQPMVMDRLNDLIDVETRLVRHLMGQADPDRALEAIEEPVIVVARELTPSVTVQLDRNAVRGMATDLGTRTSHSAILARALQIPAVVGLADLSRRVKSGQEMILDGRVGRVVVDPQASELARYEERDQQVRQWEQELRQLAHLEPETPDRELVQLRANIDFPAEAEAVRDRGAQGVGLLRTEFLVVGRATMPGEEEQYEAYRHVAETFAHEAVFIRTFDLGGDKFPVFLHMPVEENPFLGWRAVRLCLDTPELFRTQLRALLRATAHGDVRIMLPLVTTVDEIRETRRMLEEEEAGLHAASIAFNPGYKLGVMIETPAAVLIAEELGRHADFFSIGTNDLTQYTLAVDRGNARLAPRYTPFHPAVLELIRQTLHAGRAAGIEVSVCGEMAAHPLGAMMLLGLGITAMSVAPASLSEVKKVIRSVPAGVAREAAAEALEAATSDEVVEILTRHAAEWLDLSVFSGRWSLADPD
ncbi:MAG: phosphoenolpyruvate--protein phosphotransferase [Gemmatimonadota bacterium]